MKEKHVYLIVTLLNSVLFYGAYAVLMQYPFWKTVSVTYLIILAIVALAYVIYNRAFTRKGVTEEMLPLEWSDEKKREYVESAQTRLRKSKWCLTILIPLVFTFFMDIFVLFVYTPYFVPAIESIVESLGW